MINISFINYIFDSIEYTLFLNSLGDLLYIIYTFISFMLLYLLVISSTIFIGILILLSILIAQIIMLFIIDQYLFGLFLLGVYVSVILVFFIFIMISFLFFGKNYKVVKVKFSLIGSKRFYSTIREVSNSSCEYSHDELYLNSLSSIEKIDYIFNFIFNKGIRKDFRLFKEEFSENGASTILDGEYTIGKLFFYVINITKESQYKRIIVDTIHSLYTFINYFYKNDKILVDFLECTTLDEILYLSRSNFIVYCIVSAHIRKMKLMYDAILLSLQDITNGLKQLCTFYTSKFKFPSTIENELLLIIYIFHNSSSWIIGEGITYHRFISWYFTIFKIFSSFFLIYSYSSLNGYNDILAILRKLYYFKLLHIKKCNKGTFIKLCHFFFIDNNFTSSSIYLESKISKFMSMKRSDNQSIIMYDSIVHLEYSINSKQFYYTSFKETIPNNNKVFIQERITISNKVIDLNSNYVLSLSVLTGYVLDILYKIFIHFINLYSIFIFDICSLFEYIHITKVVIHNEMNLFFKNASILDIDIHINAMQSLLIILDSDSVFGKSLYVFMNNFLDILCSYNISVFDNDTYIIFKDLLCISAVSVRSNNFEFNKFFIGSLFIIFTDLELRHILMNYCLLTHNKDSIHSIEYIFKRIKEKIFNNYSTIILDNKYW